ETVAEALVADAVAHDEVVGAVDGEPAIVAVPDRGADDRAAAHRVADEGIVQGIAAEDVFLAEMAKLSVADRAGGVAVVPRVAARALRVGGFDDDVAAEVGDLGAVVTGAEMLVVESLVQCNGRALDAFDDALFRGAALFAVGLVGGGDDDAIARLPAGHG